MALYLVQHGKNLSKDVDPEKGLSNEGVAETQRIADVARDYGVKVSGIFHSGKTRALQTARIFASTLDLKDEIREVEGLKALDDVTEFAKRIDNSEDIMLVGRLPFMEKMASYLTTGSDDKTVFKFQNGGIVCLDKEPDDNHWHIKWTLMPNIG